MDVSIIICTYNPDQTIFERCLTAIENLTVKEISVEVIVVDNNSKIPISSLNYVAEFVRRVHYSKIVIEKEQGLAYARINGFRCSTGKLIIFFDDDNEPFPEYITEAKKLHDNRPFIGIIGPGYINVEYINKVDPWIRHHLNGLFQEKKAEREEYILSVLNWAPCYPPGTGQIIKRIVFEAYIENFFFKGLKTVDRKGQNLSSAGDSQLIWSSLNINYAVGHHPALKLNHLIPSKRANLTYLKRLNYYLELSGILAFIEMYPEKKILFSKYSTVKFLYGIFKIYFNGIIKKQSKSINLNIANLIGRKEASIKIYQGKMPLLLLTVKKIFKVE